MIRTRAGDNGTKKIDRRGKRQARRVLQAKIHKKKTKRKRKRRDRKKKTPDKRRGWK